MPVQSVATEFESAWVKAHCVEGWLSECEAELLWEAAQQTPEDGHIVEIGAYRGRSTTLLAESGRNVLTIDPLTHGSVCDDGVNPVEFGDDTEAALQSVVDRYDNLDWARVRSSQVQCEPQIDLLYIDGEHRHPTPIMDFWHFAPKLRDGALVAFHDFRDATSPDGRRDPGVDAAVLALERMGQLERIDHRGSMYLGRRRVRSQNVFVGQPYYTHIEQTSSESLQRASRRGLKIAACPHHSSLLAHGFNTLLGTALNKGGFDYFLLLHGDVVPLTPAWLDTLINELECYDLDALHAVVAIKDRRGVTSTAITHSTDPWAHRRLITTTELHDKLPCTFTIEEVRRHLDSEAKVLLPNTGCLLLRIGSWLDDFPGFTITDRLGWKDGRRAADTVPEDWGFGFWMHGQGLRVGGTRMVLTEHYGPVGWTTKHGWGWDHDKDFFKKIGVSYEV